MNPISRRERLLQLLRDYPVLELEELAERLDVTVEVIEADLDILRNGDPKAQAETYLGAVIQTVPLVLGALPVNGEPASVATQTAIYEDTGSKYAMILLRSGGDETTQREYVDTVLSYLHS